MNKGKLFECSDDDFLVRGRDEAEIMEIARKHIKEKHDMEASDQDLKAKIREV